MRGFFTIQGLAARQVFRERGYAFTIVFLVVIAFITIVSLEEIAQVVYTPAGYNEQHPQLMSRPLDNYALQFDKSAD